MGDTTGKKYKRNLKGKKIMQELSSKKVTLRDLYETRMIFEPEAAALACKRASDEEIAFHGALIRASHNEFIGQFLPVLTATIEKTFDLNHNLHIIAKEAYADHVMIMKFLKQRNPEAIKCAIKIHLNNAMITEELEK